jgi:hypothetical protein
MVATPHHAGTHQAQTAHTPGEARAIASREPFPVPPRRELRAPRASDAHQIHALGQAREADLVGGKARANSGEAPLALLDRLPSLLQRREIPAPAA